MLNRRRLCLALLLSAALCAVLATRVALRFDSYRVKLVQDTPVLPLNGVARVDVDRTRLDPRLQTPVAVVVRVRNDSPFPQRLSVTMDDQVLCSRVVPSSRWPRRLDCAWTGQWSSDDDHHIAVVGSSSNWELSYLELSTHHGATRGYDLIVLPGASNRYLQPSSIATSIAFVLIALAFLLPRPPISGIAITLNWIATGIAGTFLVLVFVSPYVSQFKVVISTIGFCQSVAVILATRIWFAASWASRHFGQHLRRPAVACTASALLVFAAYGAVAAHRLYQQYDGNYSGFLQLSQAAFDRNPILGSRNDVRRSLILNGGGGYDGQFMYFMTFDPFLLSYRGHPSMYDRVVDAPPYRFGRIGFSLLTRLFAMGRWRLYPETMTWVILAALFLCGLEMAFIARGSGATPMWGAVIILVPGFWQSLQTSLPEPLAAALLLGGCLCLRRDRLGCDHPGWAGLLFGASLLVRETGVILVAALIAGMLLSGRRREGLTLGLLALAPVLAWRMYLGCVLYSSWGFQAFWFNPHDVGIPFAGIFDLWTKIRQGDYFTGVPALARAGVWFPLVLVCGAAVAVAVAVEQTSSTAVAGVMYALVALSLAYESIWVHVGNAQRGTYELFLVMALISFRIRAYPRALQGGLAVFWSASAAYVFWGAFDAEYIRSAVFAGFL